MNRSVEVLNLLEQDEGMPVQDFIDAVEKAFRKEFPKAWFVSKYSKNLGETVDFFFGVLKKDSLPGNIEHNDPAHHILMVFRPKDGKVQVATVETSQIGGSLSVNPPEGSHLAYGSVKTGWRKKTANAEGLIKHLTNYFKKLKKVVMENKDNMKPEHVKGLGV